MSLWFSIPLTQQERSIRYSKPSCQASDPSGLPDPLLPWKAARGPAGGKPGHAPLGKEKAPRGLRAGRVASMCAGELHFCEQFCRSAPPSPLGHARLHQKHAGFQLRRNFTAVLGAGLTQWFLTGNQLLNGTQPGQQPRLGARRAQRLPACEMPPGDFQGPAQPLARLPHALGSRNSCQRCSYFKDRKK